MDRAQEVNEKNGIICRFIMLTPSQNIENGSFSVFCAGDIKKLVTV